MSDINLLPKKEGIRLENDQAAAVLRRISFIVLSLTAGIAIVIFILVVQSPLNKAKQQEESLLVTLQQSKILLSRNVIIQERLNSIGKVLKDRNYYEQYVNTVLDVLPESIRITSLAIDKKTMQLTGNTRSPEAANTFFTTLVSMQKEKKMIQSVTLQSFSLQSLTGTYAFLLKITFL